MTKQVTYACLLCNLSVFKFYSYKTHSCWFQNRYKSIKEAVWFHSGVWTSWFWLHSGPWQRTDLPYSWMESPGCSLCLLPFHFSSSSGELLKFFDTWTDNRQLWNLCFMGFYLRDLIDHNIYRNVHVRQNELLGWLYIELFLCSGSLLLWWRHGDFFSGFTIALDPKKLYKSGYLTK